MTAGSGPSSASRGCAGHSASASNALSASATMVAIAERACASLQETSVRGSCAAGSNSIRSTLYRPGRFTDYPNRA